MTTINEYQKGDIVLLHNSVQAYILTGELLSLLNKKAYATTTGIWLNYYDILEVVGSVPTEYMNKIVELNERTPYGDYY